VTLVLHDLSRRRHRRREPVVGKSRRSPTRRFRSRSSSSSRCRAAQSGSPSARFPARFPPTPRCSISTLDQELALIAGLNKSMRRTIGYPEVIEPTLASEHPISSAARCARRARLQRCRICAYVQCFDADELRQCAKSLPTGSCSSSAREYASAYRGRARASPATRCAQAFKRWSDDGYSAATQKPRSSTRQSAPA
jgi:hypothetical protein